jgi:short-subunit dehydrogenase
MGRAGMGRGAVPIIAAAAAVLVARRRRLRPLDGRVVLITGGSRGLGLELARRAAERGARIAICGRDDASLEGARDELERTGAQVIAVRCDVGRADEVRDMVAAVERGLGPVDVLIANAGTITVGPVEVQDPEDFREAMDTMFWGVVHSVLAVLPGMRTRGDGAIAVITSVGGKVAVPHLLPYAAAKFAAVGFSEGLAAEVAADGVRVTTVVPGLMRTGSHLNATFKGRHRGEFTWFGVGASLPLVAVDVRRAATQVLDAVERGRVEVFVGWPAKVAARVHGVVPGTTTRVLAGVDRLLPSGGAATSRRGYESQTWVTRSPITLLGARAARRQRQLQHSRGSEG